MFALLACFGGGQKWKAPVTFHDVLAEFPHNGVKTPVAAGKIESNAINRCDQSGAKKPSYELLFVPVVEALGPVTLKLVCVIGQSFGAVVV
jgi:hypothetical protein